MQIVIDIPDRIYKINQNRKLNITDVEILEKAVRNGTLLPKGHGRLIDAGAVIDNLFNSSLYDDDYYYSIAWRKVRNTPTIIEADKAESEEV